MNLVEHQLDARAMQMLAAGLRSTIVESVTNLSRKRILAIRQQLKIDTASGGQLPGTHGICSSAERLAEATMFIQIYLPIAACPAEEVDIDALITAHGQYRQLHNEVRLGHTNERVILSMDECYVLARDFRQCTIRLEYCAACRIEFLTGDIFVSRRNFCACPVCALSGRDSRKNAPTPCVGLSKTEAAENDPSVCDPVEFVVTKTRSPARKKQQLALRL